MREGPWARSGQRPLRAEIRRRSPRPLRLFGFETMLSPTLVIGLSLAYLALLLGNLVKGL